jgi:hypothetical protein
MGHNEPPTVPNVIHTLELHNFACRSRFPRACWRCGFVSRSGHGCLHLYAFVAQSSLHKMNAMRGVVSLRLTVHQYAYFISGTIRRILNKPDIERLDKFLPHEFNFRHFMKLNSTFMTSLNGPSTRIDRLRKDVQRLLETCLELSVYTHIP